MATPNGSPLPVTVVIPAHNSVRFLPATIGSVLAQTRPPAEVIVVDDGSTDETGDVAHALGARVIRQENGGCCASRNVGILAATQPFVALLDHDDLWLPDKLEKQMAAFSAFPEAVVVVTDCVVSSANGEVLEPSFAGREIAHYERLTVSERRGTVALHRNAAEELAQTGWFLMPSASLFRREQLVEAGMFDLRIRRSEDVSCFLRLLRLGPLVFINEPLTKWQIHGTNSHKDITAMLEGFLSLHDAILEEPDRYPASYLEYMNRDRPQVLLELARLALEHNMGNKARARALESLRLSPSSRAAQLYAVAFLPSPLRQRVLQHGSAVRRRMRTLLGLPNPVVRQRL